MLSLDLETAKMYGDIVTEIYLTDKNIKIADFTTNESIWAK